MSSGISIEEWDLSDGNVVGPASSVDNEIPRYDSTTGRLLQGSGVYISDGKLVSPAASSGTNQAGTAMTLATGAGTGTGAGGNYGVQTSPSVATGAGAQTLVDRHRIVAQGKALTDNSAVSLFEVALPTLKMAGGKIVYAIQVTDGTDMQSLSGEVSYAMVNKGAAYTTALSTEVQSVALSAGTLTAVTSLVSDTNKVIVKMTADTSLTPSGTNSFVIYYQILANSEQAITIL